ncbi:MAG: sporulation transcriptional regulator SpoIIID [Clostridia bacterium]|nr:sporulation transcriptional regulator SpoIIID [Clostridia bacterium]
MYEDVHLRTLEYAWYIVENRSTIRATAKHFGVAKSTVHYDLKYRLKYYDRDLYNKVKEILLINFNEKHIRGGLATKQKYLQEKEAEDFNDFNYYGC